MSFMFNKLFVHKNGNDEVELKNWKMTRSYAGPYVHDPVLYLPPMADRKTKCLAYPLYRALRISTMNYVPSTFAGTA